MNLSDLIEADYNQELIERGNLKKKENAAYLEAYKRSQWTSEGYSARLLVQVCKSCGGEQKHVQGIFHVERNGLGDTRSTKLDDRAQFPSLEAIIPLKSEVPHCADCLEILFK